MKKATIKLKTERGATLLLALLLFMVCCAVGIVVLTAGTASSGRTAELARMDRRYYSVTSAVNLLAELVDGKTVAVSQEREVIIHETTDDENPDASPIISYEKTYKRPYFTKPMEPEDRNWSNLSTASLSILEQAAYYLCVDSPQLIPGGDSFKDSVPNFAETAETYENGGRRGAMKIIWDREIPKDYGNGAPWSLTLTLDTADPALRAALENALDVDISMTLLKDGSLGFTIKNAVKAADDDNPDPDRNVYTLYLHCPCKAVTTPKPTDGNVSATKTTTLTWTAGEISARKNWTE